MPRHTQPPRLFQHKRSGYWYIRYKNNETTTGERDRNRAQRCLAAFKAELSSPEGPTIAHLIEKATPIRIDEGANKKAIEFYADQLTKHLGHLRVEDITLNNLQFFMKKSKRRTLEDLRAILNVAEKYQWIEKAPPVPLPQKYAPSIQYLTPPQLNELLNASKSTHHLYLFILIAATTGARKTSILNLTWDRVNLNTGVIDFQEPGRPITKKRRAVVPVDAKVLAVLSTAKELATCDHVIEWHGAKIKNDVRTSMEKAGARAGVFCTPHILKHTAISNFASLGYTVDDIAEFTETSPDVVRKVYRHVNPQTLRPMAKDVANMLDITEISVKRNLGEVQKTAENRGFGEWRSLVAHIVRDD